MKQNNSNTRCAHSLRVRLGITVAVAFVALSSATFAAAQGDGMKVVKDAQTGQLRAPNAEEFKTMQQQEKAAKAGKKKNMGLLTNTEAPKLMPHKRGGLKLELTEDTMVYSVATRNADGTMNMQCVTGADAAEKAMNDQSTSTKASLEHNHDVK